MSEYRDFTGKSVEEALRNAREAFGVGLDELDFEILTPGSRGVLGMGAEPARIVAAPRSALGGEAPERCGGGGHAAPCPPARDDRGPRDDRPPRRDGRPRDDRPGMTARRAGTTARATAGSARRPATAPRRFASRRRTAGSPRPLRRLDRRGEDRPGRPLADPRARGAPGREALPRPSPPARRSSPS